jgi:molecular chaperone GrpE
MQDTKKRVKNKEVEELKNQLARALADYANLEKRVAKEKEEVLQDLTRKLIIKFLPIYDMLLSAQRHLDDTGMAITINSFEQILSDEGIEIIRPKPGDDFNETICEAVEVQETDDKDKVGKIVEVILPGFKFKNGSVIRHCKVKVFKSKD